MSEKPVTSVKKVVKSVVVKPTMAFSDVNSLMQYDKSREYLEISFHENKLPKFVSSALINAGMTIEEFGANLLTEIDNAKKTTYLDKDKKEKQSKGISNEYLNSILTEFFGVPAMEVSIYSRIITEYLKANKVIGTLPAGWKVILCRPEDMRTTGLATIGEASRTIWGKK